MRQLMEITRHISAAVQEEYVASMEFVAAQSPCSTTLVKAFVNYRAAPYLPDLVAIVYQMWVLPQLPLWWWGRKGAAACGTGYTAWQHMASAARHKPVLCPAAPAAPLRRLCIDNEERQAMAQEGRSYQPRQLSARPAPPSRPHGQGQGMQ